jgi:dienelactone hydrolase
MGEAMEGFVATEVRIGARAWPVFRGGAGPGVVVIHEVPGITPGVLRFARRLVDSGFSVALPSLLGEPGAGETPGALLREFGRVCVAEDFVAFSTGRSAPAVEVCRAVARSLHAEVGGPGVGAVGMCFSGGYALAMMVGAPVIAPVLSQPSMPFALLPGRSEALDLSPAEEAAVVAQVRAGCPVMALRYRGDRLVGRRFDRLRALFGDQLLAIELPGWRHSVLTGRQGPDEAAATEAVIAFLRQRLQPAG